MESNLPKQVKAVTVSVTYHRNCYIVVDGFENVEDAARRQLRMPNDPFLDPSEWLEDEFTVIENTTELSDLVIKTINQE